MINVCMRQYGCGTIQKEHHQLVIMNKECNLINKTTGSNKKSPCGPGPTGQYMVHVCPHQGTRPMQHACCVHDEANGSGAIGCMAPLMETANRKAPP